MSITVLGKPGSMRIEEFDFISLIINGLEIIIAKNIKYGNFMLYYFV
jgi:hypothetical protein